MIIYATGWGSMIIIGYALGIADIIHSDGARAWWPATLWTAAGVIAGQTAIALGIAPTMLPVAVGNAVALGNFLCVARRAAHVHVGGGGGQGRPGHAPPPGQHRRAHRSPELARPSPRRSRPHSRTGTRR